MGTILSRYFFPVIILGLSAILLLVGIYNKGYEKASMRCEAEKTALIQAQEQEKNDIIAKIREKSPVERRKELYRYVIK